MGRSIYLVGVKEKKKEKIKYSLIIRNPLNRTNPLYFSSLFSLALFVFVVMVHPGLDTPLKVSGYKYVVVFDFAYVKLYLLDTVCTVQHTDGTRKLVF